VKARTDWPSLPLTQAFWFQEGPGVRNWQFTTTGIKLLNVANIEKGGTLNLEKTDRHLDETEVAKKYSHFLVDAGDLVIASSGISFDDDGLLRTRGAFVRAEQLPLCLNTSTIRFKAIDGVSDLRFLRLWLNGREFRSQITKLVTGTAQQNFGPSHLKATKITLPPLAEQRRIAEVLDWAEALRAKRRAALAQLDSLTQSLFLDLFGDPIRNPHGFPVRLMIELIDPQRPISYGILMPGPDQVEGVKYVRVVDMKDGRIELSGIRKTTEAISNSFRRSLLRPGDLLMSIRGHVGRFAVVPSELEGANITQDTARLAIVGASSIFVRECLRTEGFQRWMARHTKGVAVRGINLGDVKLMPIILPPQPDQDRFARRGGAVETLKKAQRASLAELDALFATLQHRAFRGEL
jgi:type I restriction enzyme S subunit